MEDTVAARIPKKVQKLIDKMMAFNPADRVKIDEVVEVLADFADTDHTPCSQRVHLRRPSGQCKACGSTLLPLVCETCGSDLRSRATRTGVLPRGTMQERPDRTTRLPAVASNTELPRLMQMITSQSSNQKLTAMTALTSRIRQDRAALLREYQKTSVVPVLVMLLKGTRECLEVQRAALTTLYVLVVGSTAAQIQAIYEEAIPCLIEIMKDGSDQLKCKAAKVFGALTYRNACLYDSPILGRERVAPLIDSLATDTEEMKSDKERARAFLNLPPSGAVHRHGVASHQLSATTA